MDLVWHSRIFINRLGWYPNLQLSRCFFGREIDSRYQPRLFHLSNYRNLRSISGRYIGYGLRGYFYLISYYRLVCLLPSVARAYTWQKCSPLGASAISHYKFKNINKRLVTYLLVPGVIGSVIGAYLLADVIDGNMSSSPILRCT